MNIDDGVTREKINKILKYAVSYADSNPPATPNTIASSLISGDQNLLTDEISWYLSRIGSSVYEMKAAIVKDRLPIPGDANREGYAPGRDLAYWVSGYAEYRLIESIAAKYDIRSGRYFDFGGSTGRVFRHFVTQTDNWDVWSSDFKLSTVEFNMTYFPKTVRVFLNTAYPFLPLPDSYFDIVSACSVFTHLNETEIGWLLELRRILKVGGVAYITILGEDAWEKDEGIRSFAEKYRPELVGVKVLPPGKTVITFRDDDPYNCNVLHSNDYIETNWGRFFEICEIRRPELLHQSTVVCRRID